MAEQIQREALAVIERQGVGALSMRGIGKACGVTPMALYYHFPDREHLLEAVLDVQFTELASSIEAQQAAFRYLPWRESLLAAMAWYVDFAIERPRLFEALFVLPRAKARQFPRDFQANESPTFNVLQVAVKELMSAGFLAPGDVLEVSYTLSSLVHGLITHYLTGRFSGSDNEFRELCARAVGRLIDGIAA